MQTQTESKTHTLQIKRVFSAKRDRVFDAWTNPAKLKKWWGMGDDWNTPIAEVDLRVGGKYRLGMQDPEKDMPYVVGGTYQEVTPPEKLVYTWKWEGQDSQTLVTVEFHEQGNSTEVILTHEYFTDEKAKEEHGQGWKGCMEQLAKIL